MTTQEKTKNAIAAITPFINIGLGVVLAVLGFFLKAELDDIKSLRSDVAYLREFAAETRANRFTSKDGQEVWREIAALRREMACVPKEVPPVWFLERVDKLDNMMTSRMDLMQTEITRLTVAVAKLEPK